MDRLPFVVAADVQGEYRTPPRVSKLLLSPKTAGHAGRFHGAERDRGREHDPRSHSRRL